MLGRAPGTRLVITGSWAGTNQQGQPLVAVTAVDGQKLSKRVLIEVGEAELRRGTTYQIEGYESGAFDYPPLWAKPKAPAHFQWRSFFMVTKLFEPDKPVSFSTPRKIQVNKLQAAGVLGKPLGTRVVITGLTVWDNMHGGSMVAVTEVDGQKLTNSVTMQIREVQLRRNTPCKIEGYESGGFSNSPQWVKPWAAVDFRWENFFVATKILEPEKER